MTAWRAGDRHAAEEDVALGSRFLMPLPAPGWAMFGVANVMSFHLEPPKMPRRMAAECGFRVVKDGFVNYSWFCLVEKTD